MSSTKEKKWILLSVASLILLLDFFLKGYVHSHMPAVPFSSPLYPYGGIAVFQNWHGIDFSIHHVVNKGAAWGMLASFQDYLLYLRLLIIAGILCYLLFVKTSKPHRFAFALILAGACGNVIDYFIYGHVVDMFHFTFWGYTYPVFNIADSSIFCGVSWLLVTSCLYNIKNKSSISHES